MKNEEGKKKEGEGGRKGVNKKKKIKKNKTKNC